MILISSNSVLSFEFSTLTRSFAALVLDDSVPIPPRVIKLVAVVPDMRTFELATLTKDPGKLDAVETQYLLFQDQWILYSILIYLNCN